MTTYPPKIKHVFAVFFLVNSICPAQNFIDLDFSHNVQATNATNPNNSTLGPDYYSGLMLEFKDVAFVDGLGVDARVSINFQSPGYEFVGYIPDYNQDAGGPEGDLGVYYRFNGDFTNPTGGISYQISFFEGGTNFSNSQRLSDVRFLIYDHDGEVGQSENITTYLADGFTGYQVNNVSGISAHDQGNTWRFEARGADYPGDSPDGGFIAYYHDTSSIRFDSSSISLNSLPYANYGVFAAYDGDLSLINGDTTNFGSIIPVPELSSSLLTIFSLTTSLIFWRRREK
jgi:hypothetical protein